MALASRLKYFNRQLALSCTLIAISSINYAFDNQGFAQTQALDAFDIKFGNYDETTATWTLPAEWLSYFTGFPYLAFAIGVLIGSFVSARWGRRMCMFVMSCYALVTATITVTSQTKNQILCGRVFNYIYIGMELSVVPVFQSEIVPHQVRGMIVCTYQLSIYFGGMLITWIVDGTSHLDGDKAWRIPLGLFYVIPTIMICCIWLIPESPRWLLTRDRGEEALANLYKLRKGAYTDEEIEIEFAVLKEALESEPEQGKWIELFQGVNLKRTAIACTVTFFQQATGQAFASQYGTIYIKSLHTINAFNYAVINGFINLGIGIACMYLTDKVGRRVFLVTGGIIQTVALMTMGALGLGTVTKPEKAGIAAMLSIYGAGFAVGWAPLTYVVASEIPALRLRDVTQRTASVVSVLTFFVVAFTLPYLLNAPYADLQSKVGFIFGSLAACAVIFTYFCVPECSGKSFEQIDELFRIGVPLRQFGSYKFDEIQDIEKPGTVITEKEVADL